LFRHDSISNGRAAAATFVASDECQGVPTMFRFSALAVTAAVLAAAPAAAQDAAPAPAARPYVGISGGYHDILDNPFGKDGGVIGGVIAGVDLAISPELATGPVVGVEGNFHLGTGAIDTEYGAAARFGYRFPSGGLAYVRAGYQWVNFDVNKVSGGILGDDDFDDTDGDYLVGVGGEFGAAGGRTRFRVGVDTVSFDTLRPNVAVIVGF
jgi:opacity protein-like surface antigen